MLPTPSFGCGEDEEIRQLFSEGFAGPNNHSNTTYLILFTNSCTNSFDIESFIYSFIYLQFLCNDRVKE